MSNFLTLVIIKKSTRDHKKMMRYYRLRSKILERSSSGLDQRRAITCVLLHGYRKSPKNDPPIVVQDDRSNFVAPLSTVLVGEGLFEKPLTNTQVEDLNKVIHGQDEQDDEVITRYTSCFTHTLSGEAGDSQVSRGSLRRLCLFDESNSESVHVKKFWLNDEVMNCVMDMLQERELSSNLKEPRCFFFKTQFYTRVRATG